MRNEFVSRVAQLCAVLILSFGRAPAMHAQALVPGFPGTNGTVNALAVAGNTLFVGGNFSLLGQESGAGVVVGATFPAAAFNDSPVLRSTNFGPGGVVFAVADDGAGGWFVGGIFTTVNGLPRSGLAHIRADRTVSAWNPGADAPVRALIRSGTTLYIGGDFSEIAAQPRTRLAAVHTTTGALLAWAPGASDAVQAFALSGATLYVGGYFTQLAGQPRTYVGAVDAATGALTPWAPAIVGATVETIAVDGTVAYVGGIFSSVNGLARTNLAGVQLATAATTAWAPNASDAVHALVVTPTSVYAGGDFGTIGGRARVGIAQLNKTSGAASPTWNAQCDGAVRALQLSGTSLMVGGAFANIGGFPRMNTASLVLTTAAAEAWSPAVDGPVNCLQLAETQVFLGGQFRFADVTPRRGLAAVDMTTLAVTPWNPDPSGLAGGEVLAMATDGARLYVGGRFSVIGGQTRAAVASFDVASGALLPFDAHINQGLAEIPSVQALSLDGGALRIAGAFSKLGAAVRHYAGAVDPVGGGPLAWAPEPDGPVTALATSSAGSFLAGDFTTIGAAPRALLAQVDAVNGAATGWLPPVFFGGFRFNGVYEPPALAVLDERDGVLFVGGSFSSAGGQSRMNAASLDIATGSVKPWAPAGGYAADRSFGVRAFETSQSPVLVGLFHPFVNGFLSLDPTTGAAAPWPPQVSGVNAIARHGARIVLAGGFATIGGAPAANLGALNDPEFPGLAVEDALNGGLALSAPWPNPMHGNAVVSLSLASPAEVTVQVLDLAGRQVRTALTGERLAAGRHTIHLAMARQAPGLYLVVVRAGNATASRKLVLSR